MDITYFLHCSLSGPTSLTLSNWNTGFRLNIQKDFLLWGGSNTGSGSSGALCSLLSWRYSEQNWTHSWATCCSWYRLEQRDLSRSSSELTCSGILWLLSVFLSGQNTHCHQTQRAVIQYTDIKEINHRVIESQNGLDWKGPLNII